MTPFLQLAYWFVLFTLIGGVALGIFVGAYYVLRERPDKKADWLFGTLLFAFAFTLVHNLLIHLDILMERPELLYLPVYFTLSLGPLLFYFVKLKLYPTYEFVWSDIKHLILPVGQFVYFVILFFQPVEVKASIGRRLFSPFYGGLEMLLYITTFFAYHYFAYRYVRYRRLKRSGPKTLLTTAWLQRLVKVLFVLFFLNGAYILTDFFSYEVFNLNLHLLPGFDYIGSLSFAMMLYWLAFNGWVMRKV